MQIKSLSSPFDSKLITTLDQIRLIHRDTDGWITFFSTSENKTQQYHYKLSEITYQLLNSWLGEDVYISMNSFFTPKRAIKNIRDIQLCYVDIDCYKSGYTTEEVLNILAKDYFNKKIPLPNMVQHSGRGIQLLFMIERMSGLALKRWSELQNEIISLLEPFGADTNAKDAARVFRLVGSINSKSNSIVYTELLHEKEYSFYEIVREYFPHMNAIKKFDELQRKKEVKKVTKSISFVTTKPKNKATTSFTPSSLADARLQDLFTLAHIRNGKCEYNREIMLFLCRYFALQIHDEQGKAIQKMRELNSLFEVPLNESELLHATASAKKYYAEGDFRITNKCIISWLNITEEEQQSMKTFISRKEKNRRQAKKRGKERKDNGLLTQAQYNHKRSLNMLRKLKRFYLLKKTYPDLSLKQYATKLGISKTTAHRYLGYLTVTFHELYTLVLAGMPSLVTGGYTGVLDVPVTATGEVIDHLIWLVEHDQLKDIYEKLKKIEIDYFNHDG